MPRTVPYHIVEKSGVVHHTKLGRSYRFRRLYSITSSARASSVGGTVSPSALAVFLASCSARVVIVPGVDVPGEAELRVTRPLKRMFGPSYSSALRVGGSVLKKNWLGRRTAAANAHLQLAKVIEPRRYPAGALTGFARRRGRTGLLTVLAPHRVSRNRCEERLPMVLPNGHGTLLSAPSPLVCETAERASGLHFPRLAPDILGWAHRLLKSITVSDAAQTNISRRTASLHHGAMLICVGVLF